MHIERLKWTSGAALAAAMAFAPSALAAPADDTQAVLAANAGFYAALNQMFVGNIEPMAAVWSHADDVVFMGPNGLVQRGWTAAFKDWKNEAAMKLGGKVEASDVEAIVGDNLAVVTDVELGANTDAKGKPEDVRLRATNVFRKENGAWKLVVHHTDLLPYLSK